MSESPEHNRSELGPAAEHVDDQAMIERTRLRIADEQVVARFIVDAARLMSDSHCQDVRIFDVRGKSDVTDYLIIASGTSDRQIRSVAEDVEELAAGQGMHRFGRDEDAPSKWVVIDFIDVIVHLFEPHTRGYYDLEMMWGDAPQVPWRRP